MNHPGWPPCKWGDARLKSGLAGTAIDAWEHLPVKYEQWKKQGALPTVVGGTDTHHCLFGCFERTIVLAPSPAGDDVAEAVRGGRTVALCGSDGPNPYLFGSDSMISLVRSALADGKALKDRKAAQLREALMNADVAGLLETSSAKPPKDR